MSDKPEVFSILTSNGRLGVAWQPNKEAGGCEVLKWVPDDFIKEAYRAILNRDATDAPD